MRNRFLACVFFCLLGASASADWREKAVGRVLAADLSAEAKAAYQEGDYARAAELYQRAYVQDDEPTLLYNIARCYQELQNEAEAKRYYEEFLEKSRPSAAYREEAKRALTGQGKSRALATVDHAPDAVRPLYIGAIVTTGVAAGLGLSSLFMGARARRELNQIEADGALTLDEAIRVEELQEVDLATADQLASSADALLFLAAPAAMLAFAITQRQEKVRDEVKQQNVSVGALPGGLTLRVQF
jgi:tetratricopeptide (TPR) repeat protein